MSEIVSDAAIMSALGRQLTRAVQKQAVAAGNLANLDTPGYRTQEISFLETLDGELGTPVLRATNSRHFGTPGAGPEGRKGETPGLAVRRDGNNVQLDHELLALGSASADFSAAQAVLSAKFRLVRYAINEGR